MTNKPIILWFFNLIRLDNLLRLIRLKLFIGQTLKNLGLIITCCYPTNYWLTLNPYFTHNLKTLVGDVDDY
jgi:hypothetical protein